MGTAPVLAQGITIDGNFTDWAGKASLVDPGGADDEKTPSRADITEFRAYADSNGIYLLKAWDDTSFTGGGSKHSRYNPTHGWQRLLPHLYDCPGQSRVSTALKLGHQQLH